MKRKSVLALILLLVLTTALARADDGIMFRRNVSHTPDQETDGASLSHMTFYVPAQSSDGTVLTEGIQYLAADGTTAMDPRLYAKPLVAVYLDDLPHDELLRSGGAADGEIGRAHV